MGNHIAWAELLDSSRALPSARSAHVDGVRSGHQQRLIMFGGLRRHRRLLDDTWAYDPAANTWTELKPSGTLPSARSAHSMVYDPVTHRLIMFGGFGDTGASPQRHLGLRSCRRHLDRAQALGHAALGTLARTRWRTIRSADG